MSTHSSDLRIELIGTGDQSGVWGDTTNDNFQYVLEPAIAGAISVSVISANQALTYVDGPSSVLADNQAVHAVLTLTTSTGANFNVYAPNSSKLYTIYNASSYIATIYNSTVNGNTTAAGTGVAIPAGATMTVWSDSTDFYVQNTHLTAPTISNPTVTTGSFSTPALTTPKVVTSINDTNGNQLINVTATASAVNEITLANAATGNAPTITASGDDTNISLSLNAKGSGTVNVGSTPVVTTTGTQTLTNKTLTSPAIGTSVLDTNGNELLAVTATASAVNEITLANAATGNAPTLTASGNDTNISLSLNAKGSGTVNIGSVPIVTTSGTQTLTNKTLTSPTLTTPILGTPQSGNFGSGTFTWPTFNQNTSGTAAGLSSTLAVSSGGTGGTATPTSGGLAYGNGTAYAFTSAGSSGEVLTSAGSGTPAWTAQSSLSVGYASSAGSAGFATNAGNGGVTSVNTFTGAVQSVLTQKTAQASTSGTSIDFTSIPSWAKRVTVMFAGTSVNTASYILIQLIYGGSTVVTSGYRSSGCRLNGTNSSAEASSTAGFVFVVPSATDDLWGNVSITNLTSNTWTASGNVTYASGIMMTSGGVAISGTLTGVRITTVSGTSTFDAGSINVMYE